MTNSPREATERYRRLPTGTHGLAREDVRRDQRERLQRAMIELIARRGYRAVRILDVTKLARVSRPTFYELYADKEALLVGAYDEIAERAAKTITAVYETEGTADEHLRAGIRAFVELAAADPEAMSLFVLGAFGAGPKALEHRKLTLQALERVVLSSRDPAATEPTTDLTVKLILGGVREVAATRLRAGRSSELLEIAGELADWASCYPLKLPRALHLGTAAERAKPTGERTVTTESSRQAKGPLPSGRHALSRSFIVQNQRERIIEATAATIAAKGLAGLTIPEIARRANVSHQTFYELYPTKHDAYLGALKVSLHQAMLVVAGALDAHQDDWPRAVVAGARALIEYIASQPDYAHLSLVDTFAANPDAIEIREEALRALSAYLGPGYQRTGRGRTVPAIAAEAITGGVWQILHDYIDEDRAAELTDLVAQVAYLALVPFIGSRAAAQAALEPATRR
jgi:AcrR family transcriptional regulator